MITSRKRGRWIVPKGSLIKGRTPAQSAARGAFEEAGVFGDIHPAPIGSYTHGNLLEEGLKAPVHVTLFALRVRATLLQWPGKNERIRSWQSLTEAVEMASEPGLGRLLKYAQDELSIFKPVKPERTFWEKVLILHAMTEMTEKRNAEQNAERKVPDLNQYSRHYYDVHQIWNHPDQGKTTASMLDLAEACRQHKELMFRAPDHRYDRAPPGDFRLVPTADVRNKLATDYAGMSAMIFATPPDFDAVMTSIEDLEKFFNKER